MSELPPQDDATTQQPSEPQQPADDELYFPDLTLGDAWGESITKQRAAELEAILQAWEAEKEHGERKGPFDGIPDAVLPMHLTGADVFWLAALTLAKPRGDIAWAHAELLRDREEVRVYFFPSLSTLHLEGANLDYAHLQGANLGLAHLEGARLGSASLEGAALVRTNLGSASLSNAYLQGAHLYEAHLENAFLHAANLEGADLTEAHLEGADLTKAHLEAANVKGAYLDDTTKLKEVTLGNETLGFISLADVHWRNTNLAVVDWTQMRPAFFGTGKRVEAIELGDEREARKWKDYKDAVRANRQLATVLRQQGLNEDADRFAYKAQKLQRHVLRLQQRYVAVFGSWLLDIVAGYGYKPMRTLTVYLLAIITFAIAYFALGQTVGPHLSPLGAFVFSMTSFHGRGFFPGGIVLDDPITVLAAFEAFIGLVIEVSFIATFTQRFFAR